MTGKRPNILFVFTDQQHFQAVSAFGNPHLHTPAMDRLAARGVRFTQAYATDPVCAPSRSSFFYGRMPVETGVYKNELHPRADLPTIGAWLSDKGGYRSVYSGKWHLMLSQTFNIPGFEVIATGANCEGTSSDSVITRSCEAFLHSYDEDRPFFLVASYQQPHDVHGWIDTNSPNPGRLRYPEIAGELPPLSPTLHVGFEEPEHLKRMRSEMPGWANRWSDEHWRYYEWNYYRQVEMVDAEIGRLLEALEQSPHARDTLVLFTSDHGEGLGRNGLQYKSYLYDDAIRLPLIASWPGHLPEGAVRHELVSGLDFAATMCDYAGVEKLPGSLGLSFRPFAEGRGSDQPAMHPYVVGTCQANQGRMVRTERFKYVTFRDDPVELLFDMDADPLESVNLGLDPAFAPVLEIHRAHLREWESRMEYAPEVPRFFDT